MGLWPTSAYPVFWDNVFSGPEKLHKHHSDRFGDGKTFESPTMCRYLLSYLKSLYLFHSVPTMCSYACILSFYIHIKYIMSCIGIFLPHTCLGQLWIHTQKIPNICPILMPHPQARTCQEVLVSTSSRKSTCAKAWKPCCRVACLACPRPGNTTKRLNQLRLEFFFWWDMVKIMPGEITAWMSHSPKWVR